METFNLGAVLFALLLLLWLAYALPQVASRRDLMGQARAAERAEVSASARDLSEIARARRPSHEVTAPMRDDRLLLRPADPTRRPRFDDEPGTRIDHDLERHRSRRLLKAVLAVLALALVAVGAAAALSYAPWWTPIIPAVALGLYVIGLRRAELERRNRVARAARRARQQPPPQGALNGRPVTGSTPPSRAPGPLPTPQPVITIAPMIWMPRLSWPRSASQRQGSGSRVRCLAPPMPCAVTSTTSPPATQRTVPSWVLLSRSKPMTSRNSKRPTNHCRLPWTSTWMPCSPGVAPEQECCDGAFCGADERDSRRTDRPR